MDTPRPGPARSLFFFAVFYGGMVCIAGVLGNKQVALGPLAVEAGIFAFLLLVVTSSAVAELHGRAVANRLVLAGFVPLLMSVVLSWVVFYLPAAPEMQAEGRTAIQYVLGGTWRIWLGGITAYGISTLLNVTIFSKLKGAIRESGFRADITDRDTGAVKRLDVAVTSRSGASDWLWLRAGVAAVLSQIVDTLIFVTIAFSGVFPIGELLLGQMLAKVTLSLVLVPPLIYLFVSLGRRLDR